MKLTALAVVILALGIFIGFALAGGASEGPASAAPKCPGPSPQCPTPTPAPPQQREDQIMLMSWPGDSGVTPCSTIYSPILQSDVAGCPTTSGRERLVGVELDEADYPASTTFRLEAAFLAAGNSTPFCVRLFDNTANVPVLDSEVCRNAGATNTIFSVRSAAFTIADGGHEYVLQGKERGGGFVYTARIIVEWTE